MTAGRVELEAMKGCRAAIAVVAACRHNLPLTVAEAIDGADAAWTVVGLGHLAAALLAQMPDDEADEWLRGKALRIAIDLAALERQTKPGRDREAT